MKVFAGGGTPFSGWGMKRVSPVYAKGEYG